MVGCEAMEDCFTFQLRAEPQTMKCLDFEGRGRFRLNQSPAPKKDQSRHTRRAHKKSRSGCQACRARRVKCDEERPVCSRCSYTESCCVYDGPGKKQPSDLRIPVASQHQKSPRLQDYGTCLALGQDEVRIRKLLGYSDDINDVSNKLQRSMTPDVQVFHHFAKITCFTMAGPMPQKALIQNVFIPFATQHSSLMHALLAISSRHMMYLQPDDKAHQLAHAFHMQKATSRLQQRLSSPLGRHNMDLVIANCLTLNAVCITYDKFEPSDSWVFAEDDRAQRKRLFWVEMQVYACKIFNVFSEYVKDSIWAPTFMEHGPESFRPQSLAELTKEGADGIPQTLAELCDIGPHSSARNNPYHMALRHMNLIILGMERSSPHLYNLIICFIGQIQPDFRLLLIDKDERALLIFAYWLALMYDMGLWWTAGRARNEGMAICMVLDKSTEPNIKTLMQFPAKKFGYKMSSVPEEVTSSIETKKFVNKMIVLCA